MILFVGLGNPGGQYQRHRHNIGFMVVDEIADAYSFGPEKQKFQGLVREGHLKTSTGTEKVLILKPSTYMNESGRAAAEAVRFFKIDPDDIIVFHDELDLAAGKVRVKQGGGLAGHNGLRSLKAHIGSNFRRVRIGIGHPGHKDAVHSHVLKDFSKDDLKWVEPLLHAISKAAPVLASGDDANFMNQVALEMNPTPLKKKD